MAKPVQNTTRNSRTGSTSRSTARPAGKTLGTRNSPNVVKPFNMPFEQKNIMLIIAGVVTICLGYFLMWVSPTMSTMALTISPIILLIGYCVVVPMGIMAGSKTYKRDRQPVTEPTNTLA